MELSRNLKVDSVSRLAPTTPLCLEATCPVSEAVERMRCRRVGCLLVTEGGKLTGIFTERDLMARVLAPGLSLATSLDAVMTPAPDTVGWKDPVKVAVRKMESGGHRHLPVVDEAGRPTGILSVKRLVHYLVEHFPATVYNLSPDPRAYPRRREGA